MHIAYCKLEVLPILNPLIKGRLLRAVDYIEQETDVLSSSECKIVVFSAHTATLREFMNVFSERIQPQGIQVVAFSADMDREDLDDSVYQRPPPLFYRALCKSTH